ncbi:hypothetical protein LG200_02275 [Methylobacillus caricis]|uniref:hypothetical protein n=1 Tax=Methylobacillus caricis TaxID=1971611 RepID=UPI001CFFE18C|nr:hypothetical protein [Methylobacillus caricis]MCB5186827.1 hypothetical protein [Methylobacillus caricis]
MQLFKVCISFDDSGDIYFSDAFEHEDLIWLAINWENDAAGTRKRPERIVGLPKDHLKPTTDSLHYEYLLPRSLPSTLKTAESASEVPEGYFIQFRPDITFASLH